MVQVLRVVGGVIAGLVAAFALVIAVEMFSAVVHPFPPDFGGTEEEICQHVERYPAWVLAAVVVLWATTAFVGAWIAGRVGNRGSAVFVGLLTLAGLILNLSMLPYPIWFKLACLVAVPCAIVFAVIRSGRRQTAPLGVTG